MQIAFCVYLIEVPPLSKLKVGVFSVETVNLRINNKCKRVTTYIHFVIVNAEFLFLYTLKV
ncbi:hypothetical protein PMEGAPL125_26580 [Priestia megaterium]|uniref:Uncharacterized protein n=1 Tax=Priestia megaterium TaxID=1404 RepID=A0AAX6BFJ2_PRIMG|nr:hypothetical protein ShirakiTB12_09560 [Priestia megaterium]